MDNYEDKCTIEQKLIKILQKNIKDSSPTDILKPEDPLTVLGINSVLFIKLAVEIENEFGFEFEDENLDVEKFSNIASIIKYIKGKQL